MNWRKFLYALVSLLFIKPTLNAQSLKFTFGEANNKEHFTNVKPADSYGPERGYGFEFSQEVRTYHDYVTSSKPFYFSIKIPEGNYNVKVLLGDKNGVSITTIK